MEKLIALTSRMNKTAQQPSRKQQTRRHLSISTATSVKIGCLSVLTQNVFLIGEFFKYFH